MTNQEIQQALNTLGYGPLAVDGIVGPMTTAAVKSFQRAHPPLAVDGDPGPMTQAALTAAMISPLDNVPNLSAPAAAPIAPMTLAQVLGASPAPAAPRIVAVTTPSVAPSSLLPLGALGSTLHVNTATGAVKSVQAGTPVPSALHPSTWTMPEKIFGVAALGAAAWGIKKYWRRLRAMAHV